MNSRPGRTPQWQAYYELHPEVLASWAEQNGRTPPHEPGCTDPREFCWCAMLCGFCGHHADDHECGRPGPIVLCAQCADDVCPR